MNTARVGFCQVQGAGYHARLKKYKFGLVKAKIGDIILARNLDYGCTHQ